MGKQKIISALFLFFSFLSIQAQELNCVVEVNSRQVEGSERKVFQELQKAVFQFVNGRKWTNDEYETYERIDCSILITLENRLGANQFSGNIQVQASRPVYNTSYKTPIMNVRDEDFVITYNQFEPLIFAENSYSGELVSILTYYIYMILGYDYDSFELEGGTPYFQQAQRIVSNSQNSGEKGWKASESRRNRYWLVQNHMSARFKSLRSTYYDYHRKAFDIMESDVTKGRNVISNSLKDLKRVHNVAPSSYNLQVFFLAKVQEITELFSEATPAEVNDLTETLITIDPGNAGKYEKLRKR
jgi:hypothetical protein